ncbi:MAG: glucose-6-phosphate isomerase [Chloroflexi bacterium]|nr:glucose-6-phosphate isomerase [Chloroflexota bacterium]
MNPGQTSASTTLQKLIADRVANRIFKKDASLWPPESPGAEPASEIMGWLELPSLLDTKTGLLHATVADLRSRGITDLVVLGMGGSSMTPEVLRVVFGIQRGGINLHVLDTVNPETIGPVTSSLPLVSTAFIVASKSGTTVEPLSLEKHFRSALSDAGVSDGSAHFIAITDARTPLAQRAQGGQFAHWLETPRDVGGRFSALTAFGMFPAAALGIDVQQLQQSASRMATTCAMDTENNPGLMLGAVLGANALSGRDKVTLITSPGLERFGLWVEQLLAESTGKHGKGLIPIAGEDLYPVDWYGDDRNFVYVRLEGADNSATDNHISSLEKSSHPVTTLEMRDLYDIGAEFFRWEFATAVAGHVINIFPFDQPDVNAAKDKARVILDSGKLPSGDSISDLDSALKLLIETPKIGDYVAIGAFLPESSGLTHAFSKLRAFITKTTGMATTFGYGPRYLHSTGQLFKGGPNSIRFIGVVSHGSGDIKVPGESYTLGALTPAQAYGDFEVLRDRGRRIRTATLRNNAVAEIEGALRD